MKTTRHFWLYFTHFSLEWEMFQTKVVQEIKTHFLCSATFFFRIWCRLWDNVEKHCRAGEATDDNNGACALYAGYLRLHTHTHTHTHSHSEYVILIAFPLQQWVQEGTSMLRYTYTACRMSTFIHIYQFKYVCAYVCVQLRTVSVA